MCKKCISIFILVFVPLLSFSQSVVSIPVEQLETWISQLENSQQKTIDLQLKTDDLQKRLESLLSDYKLLTMNLQASQADLAKLDKDYQKLAAEYQEYLIACDLIYQKLNRRSKILIGSLILNLLLAVVVVVAN